MKHTIDNLPFTNSFASLGDAFYSKVNPTPFSQDSYLIHLNENAATLLKLDTSKQNTQRLTEVLSGQALPVGAEPLAMLYSGHQFGYYVEQLGDGRAIMLGEVSTDTSTRWEIQLKGSGITPYSRQGDGRAVLRSSIREYLCSEAMHGLGIPTTRALCLTGNNDEVYREQIETAAVLTRIAPTHIRFGSFETFFYRSQPDNIKTLADFVIKNYYPELLKAKNSYLELLKAVIDRTAKLIAQWQSVGFAHGVMNTDNMSIVGLTLDYGPFGFLDNYNPKFICNHSDYEGRYAFENQPQIGLFNLSCLAQALLPLMDVQAAKDALETYQQTYTHYYNQLMAEKLGFEKTDAKVDKLITELLEQMQQSGTDYTMLFRQLSLPETKPQELADMFIDRNSFNLWYSDYKNYFTVVNLNLDEQRKKMLLTNPKYILRNYMAQIAINKAEQQDYSEIDKLLKILHSPFDEHPDMQHYAGLPPDWADSISVSCSS